MYLSFSRGTKYEGVSCKMIVSFQKIFRIEIENLCCPWKKRIVDKLLAKMLDKTNFKIENTYISIQKHKQIYREN